MRSSRISSIHRANAYRIPGQRHATKAAASFLLRQSSLGCVIDMLPSDPTLRQHVVDRLAVEVASVAAAPRVRTKALERGRRLLTHDLAELKAVIESMADASDHQAFCWYAPALTLLSTCDLVSPLPEARCPALARNLLSARREMKVLTHPGRACWLYLVICQLLGEEAVTLGRADPEPLPVACPICLGSYISDLPGTVDYTFHLDCGNGCVALMPTSPLTSGAHHFL